jgi:hypothetical protein
MYKFPDVSIATPSKVLPSGELVAAIPEVGDPLVPSPA